MQQKQRRTKKNGIQKSLMIVIILTLAFVLLGVIEALSSYHILSGTLSELASIAIVVLAVISTIWQGRLPKSSPSIPLDTSSTTLLPRISGSSQKPAIDSDATILLPRIPRSTQKPAIDATPTTLLPAIPKSTQKPTIEATPTIAVPAVAASPQPPAIEATPTIAVPAAATTLQQQLVEVMPTIAVPAIAATPQPAIAATSQQQPIEAMPTIAVPAIATPQPAIAATERLANKPNGSRIAKQTHMLDTIFHFNEPHLPIQDELYGRKRESITLLDRARKGLCTSIEGSRRIGKTWLLDYLRLELREDKKFLVGTIDGTMPQCRTETEFCARTLESFGRTSIPANAGLDMLSRFVREQKSCGIIPILCIDEFEGLLNEHFGPNFFTSLRYIAETDDLGLVIVSKRPLVDLVSEHCKSSSVETSPFSNIAQPLKLGPFNLGQAEEFTEEKSAAAGWNDEEYAALLKYAQTKRGWPPLLLQLVGQTLQTDKHLAATGDATSYRPSDPAYWSDFQRRIREQYRKVVPK